MLYWLIIAHFIFDWGLQTRWMADNKSKYWEVLLAHCFIYTGGITLVLEYFKVFNYFIVFFILVGHFITDYISSRMFKIYQTRYILWIDHIVHFLQLFIIYKLFI